MRKCESCSVSKVPDSKLKQWNVEALNTDGDGGVDLVVFSGPDARQRAREYASSVYRNGETRMKQFLAGLTDLCNQHGVGMTGDADLYLMHREDYNLMLRPELGPFGNPKAVSTPGCVLKSSSSFSGLYLWPILASELTLGVAEVRAR